MPCISNSVNSEQDKITSLREKMLMLQAQLQVVKAKRRLPRKETGARHSCRYQRGLQSLPPTALEERSSSIQEVSVSINKGRMAPGAGF